MSEFERDAFENDAARIAHDRLVRDTELTAVIQAGYTPAEPTKENSKPRIIDGTLDQDAQQAMSSLWSAYERFAFKITNQLAGRVTDLPTVDTEDLIQECFWGLYHAAVRWTPDRQHTFSTHAGNVMEKFALHYISVKQSAVAIPEERHERIRRSQAVSWDMYAQTQHMPTRERLARALEITPQQLRDLWLDQALTSEMGSLEGGYFEDSRDRHSVFGVQQPKRWIPINPAETEQRTVEEEFLTLDIKRVIANARSSVRLSQDEEFVLRERFLTLTPKKLSEVGGLIGLDTEQVRRIEAKLLAKLRRPEVSAGLRIYLGQE